MGILKDFRDGNIGFSPGTYIFWICFSMVALSYPFYSENDAHMQSLSNGMLLVGLFAGGAIALYATNSESTLAKILKTPGRVIDLFIFHS